MVKGILFCVDFDWFIVYNIGILSERDELIMATSHEPILKTCRSLDISPALLGIEKHTVRAGGRTATVRPKKQSEYALQLREKQRVKFVYGVLEKQFYRTFQHARAMRGGLIGENLLMLMERWLDNVVYRLGLVNTRRQARQAVSHGHVLVNGKRVNIPSYRVKVGDSIEVAPKSRASDLFVPAKERTSIVPSWLSLDASHLSGLVQRLPEGSDIDLPVNESLIVEFYSR